MVAITQAHLRIENAGKPNALRPSRIALLISILLPSLNRARDQARTAVCLSNLKQLGLAFALYAEDNRGRLSAIYTQPSYIDVWNRLISPYMSRPTTEAFGQEYMRCPSQPPESYRTYGCNYPICLSPLGLDVGREMGQTRQHTGNCLHGG